MTVRNKRLIFTATIAGVTLFTIYKVTREKKTYVEVPSEVVQFPGTTANTEPEPEFEPVKSKEKIKDKLNKVKLAIQKRVNKILKFLVAHEDEIITIKDCITLVASVYTLKSAIQKTKRLESVTQTPLLTTSGETSKSFDVKTGDVLVGEWDNAGQYLHFSVV